MSDPGTVVVNGRGARRTRRGHPWIHREDLRSIDADAGAIVRVVDAGGAPCGWAAYSPASRIALRVVQRGGGPGAAPPDDRFWAARLERALQLRGAAAAAGPGCARLLHADADGFPGLIVDRYGSHLVAQRTTVWAEKHGAALLEALAARVGAESVLARDDAPGREAEGLPRAVVQLVGTTPASIEAEAGGALRRIDPWQGHKTGLYLDQQENQRRAPAWFPEGPVLDAFCAEGGFALPLAAAGREVTAIDQSRPGLERALAAAESAGVDDRIEFVHGNVFDFLAQCEAEGRRFPAIVLDPPPFARRRSGAAGAARGYRDLHRRALRCLAPGGRMATFCCTATVGAEEFEAMVREG
ncbi:MAG: methyltransferase domain-containing protein, partial [Acidobacteria bacterium]|nr:methyltransferase domain-containing protein [Acidobacteriota bacterium]